MCFAKYTQNRKKKCGNILHFTLYQDLSYGDLFGAKLEVGLIKIYFFIWLLSIELIKRTLTKIQSDLQTFFSDSSANADFF